MGTKSMSHVRFVTLALVSIVFVLAFGTAEAVEVLSNPGFESGALTPWTTNGTWVIETTNCHSGSYCASNGGDNYIQQTFPGVPTGGITNITFWMRQPVGSIAGVNLDYSDATTSWTTVDPTASWSQFDVTSYLQPGKTLTGLRIWGYTSGGTAPDVSVLDDVSIQSQSLEAIPMLGWQGLLALALAIAAVGALLSRSRLA